MVSCAEEVPEVLTGASLASGLGGEGVCGGRGARGEGFSVEFGGVVGFGDELADLVLRAVSWGGCCGVGEYIHRVWFEDLCQLLRREFHPGWLQRQSLEVVSRIQVIENSGMTYSGFQQRC